MILPTSSSFYAKASACSISSWEASSRYSFVRPLKSVSFRWAGRRAVELTLFVDPINSFVAVFPLGLDEASI